MKNISLGTLIVFGSVLFFGAVWAGWSIYTNTGMPARMWFALLHADEDNTGPPGEPTVFFYGGNDDGFYAGTCHALPGPPDSGLPVRFACVAGTAGDLLGTPVTYTVWARALGAVGALEVDVAMPLEEFEAGPEAAAANWLGLPRLGQAIEKPGPLGPVEEISLIASTELPQGRYQMILKAQAPGGNSKVFVGREFAVTEGPPRDASPAAAAPAAPTAPPDPAAPEAGSEPAATWNLEGGAEPSTVSAWVYPAQPLAPGPVTVDLELRSEAVDSLRVDAAIWFLDLRDHPGAVQEVLPLDPLQAEGTWTMLAAWPVDRSRGSRWYRGAVDLPAGRHQLVVRIRDADDTFAGLLVGPVLSVPGE